MRCPYCRHPDSRVVDSREQDEGQVIRRRRSCPECGRRFTTVEEATLAVIKRSGVTEPFSRQKVVSGVRRACQGRPVDEDALAQLAQPSRRRSAPPARPRCPATRSGWRSSARCASSTRWPTCASPASTRPSARIDDFEKAITDLRTRRATTWPAPDPQHPTTQSPRDRPRPAPAPEGIISDDRG